MATPLQIAEKRMFLLLDYALDNNLVSTKSEFWEKIRFSLGSVTNVKNGTQFFTREHIRNACLLTGANANWVLDLEKQMFRDKGKAKTPIQQLREAVAAVEQELTKKKQTARPEVLN